jgi:hypothetical protein
VFFYCRFLRFGGDFIERASAKISNNSSNKFLSGRILQYINVLFPQRLEACIHLLQLTTAAILFDLHIFLFPRNPSVFGENLSTRKD